MPKKKHKPEEIVAKLRQADVLISQGQDIADVIRQIGVSEVAYAMNCSMVKCQRRLKDASVFRSKNTSMILSRRPPNWGPFRQASGLVGIIRRQVRTGTA